PVLDYFDFLAWVTTRADISFQVTHQILVLIFQGTISETPHRSSKAKNLVTLLQRMVNLNRLLPLFYFCAAASAQSLCRRNERYVECGKCEATCTNPNTECQHGCLSSRCECVAALNYVRDRHGACIKITDCDVPTVLITFESSNAFRKIFGKLYNEARIVHGTHSGSMEMSRPQPPEATEVHSYPPEHFREPVIHYSLDTPEVPIIHSHPPENTPEEIHSYPSENTSEDVHSYPPEHLREPAIHYSLDTPRVPIIRSYPLENTPGDVHSYPPENTPEEAHSYPSENTPEDVHSYPPENFREHVIQSYPPETHAPLIHSYPPENVPEAVHSYPPEGIGETGKHSIPVRHPSSNADIHSYPPEDRFRNIPARRYARYIREHPPSARDIRSYSQDDIDEETDVVTYKPESSEEATSPDYPPLPFVSDYGNIASHESGTFYTYYGTKEESSTQRYDPYDPRRFEQAKVVSKLKKSSLLRQVPPEVSVNLRDIGGKSSLQDLANAMVLFDFQPPITVERVNESQVVPNATGLSSYGTWTTPPIILQDTSTSSSGNPGSRNVPMETHGTLRTNPVDPSTMTDVNTRITGEVSSGSQESDETTFEQAHDAPKPSAPIRKTQTSPDPNSGSSINGRHPSGDKANHVGETNSTGTPHIPCRTAPNTKSLTNPKPVVVESSAITLNTNVASSAEVPNATSQSATTLSTASQRGVAPRVENPSAPFSTITHEARTPYEMAVSTTNAEEPGAPHVETSHAMLNTTSRETAMPAKNRSEGRTQLNTQHIPAHNDAIITTITFVKAEMKSPVISKEGSHAERFIPNIQSNYTYTAVGLEAEQAYRQQFNQTTHNHAGSSIPKISTFWEEMAQKIPLPESSPYRGGSDKITTDTTRQKHNQTNISKTGRYWEQIAQSSARSIILPRGSRRNESGQFFAPTNPTLEKSRTTSRAAAAILPHTLLVSDNETPPSFRPQYQKYAISSQLHHSVPQQSHSLAVSLDTPQGSVFYQKPLRYRRRLKK
ncbi:hypothetical protein GCK32_007292, partial [Trichostrongylus colubriformis]